MNRFVRVKDYAGLEAEYRRLCETLSGEERTRAIDELPFDQYEKDLRKGFEQAAASIGANSGRCIFLRLRPDIEWNGAFHVQAKDPGIDEPQEEFSYEGPLAGFSGPSFPAAARIYAQRSLFSGTQPSGAALYLLARTIAAFGRCLNTESGLVAVYFSCMYAVFRMS
jgi:hypothetical protein